MNLTTVPTISQRFKGRTDRVDAHRHWACRPAISVHHYLSICRAPQLLPLPGSRRRLPTRHRSRRRPQSMSAEQLIDAKDDDHALPVILLSTPCRSRPPRIRTTESLDPIQLCSCLSHLRCRRAGVKSILLHQRSRPFRCRRQEATPPSIPTRSLRVVDSRMSLSHGPHIRSSPYNTLYHPHTSPLLSIGCFRLRQSSSYPILSPRCHRKKRDSSSNSIGSRSNIHDSVNTVINF